ncbi:MAG: hypothetical protein M3N82_11580 [Pseudomonadota bacterium]|nr:hypothetical protein [Pseudomonadota bacterium]
MRQKFVAWRSLVVEIRRLQASLSGASSKGMRQKWRAGRRRGHQRRRLRLRLEEEHGNARRRHVDLDSRNDPGRQGHADAC